MSEVNSNPYRTLIQEYDNGENTNLKDMCETLQEQADDCLCKGHVSTHPWYTQSVNDDTHHGPGCISQITYGEERCLLATICQNRFPDVKLPPCEDGNSCKYPLWVGKGSGFEEISEELPKCVDWHCIGENVEVPERWHDGKDARKFIDDWTTYKNKIQNYKNY